MTDAAPQGQLKRGDYHAALLAAPRFGRLIWFVLLGSLGNVAAVETRMSEPDAALSLAILSLATLVASIRAAWAAYRLAAAMGKRHPVAYGVACLVPVVSAFALVWISRSASRWFRARGLEVGLFGPTRASRERLSNALLAGVPDLPPP
jgi:hypothetical protein